MVLMRFKNVMKVFKNFAISGKIIFLLIFISSINPKVCKSEGFFTPYRLFFGFKQKITGLETSLSLEERGLEKGDSGSSQNQSQPGSSICFKNKSKHKDVIAEIVDPGGGLNPHSCRTKKDFNEYGYANFLEPLYPDVALEFSPNYFLDIIGYYLYVTYRSFNFETVDYPMKDQEYYGVINSISFSVPFFLYLGDKNLGKEGDFSLRLGLGPSMNYVSEFEMRTDTDSFKNEGNYYGHSTFFDLTFLYFTFKMEDSYYTMPGLKNDKITVEQTDRRIGFYYYF